MTGTDRIREEILAALTAIAPEIEADNVDERAPLRQQVDLDSMDWLNFLRGVHERLQLDIPEVDYKRLRTLADLVEYAEQRTAGRRG
ncbi:acyl carrier protein [Mycolicibacterium fluoranthenivorans]|uniref:acyl carrier protein n=1 Tax=Mycolicibacterium fluoranthenivorans TaxID=258505 RepID=UPI001F258D70|nr:phosphopantetheine-binding protein [Mycolicibacterium fluoranthenivorans]